MKKSYLLLLAAAVMATSACCMHKDKPCCYNLQHSYTSTVYFDFDSAELSQQDMEKLNEIPQMLKNCPNLKVMVTGYADNVGKDAYNIKLGVKRAEVVQQYLMSKGVKYCSIKDGSMGASDPADSNKTAEGRALNRRAVVQFQ